MVCYDRVCYGVVLNDISCYGKTCHAIARNGVAGHGLTWQHLVWPDMAALVWLGKSCPRGGSWQWSPDGQPPVLHVILFSPLDGAGSWCVNMVNISGGGDGVGGGVDGHHRGGDGDCGPQFVVMLVVFKSQTYVMANNKVSPNLPDCLPDGSPQ